VQVRSHISSVDALQSIKQTFFNLNLCREDDGGASTPVDAYKLNKDCLRPPILWKVVFRSAEAAGMVLERYIRGGQRDIHLRAFESREELEQTAAMFNVQPERVTKQPCRPVRHGSDVTEALARAPSSNSVTIVEPPLKREEKPNPEPTQPQPPAARIQFTTRHSAQQVQQVAAPQAADVSELPIATAQVLQVAPPPPQSMGGAYPHGWVAYPPPPRPLVPMLHPYHSPPPGPGIYMQHPSGPYPYGAPMGYAPAGFVSAPMVYPSYPPQF